MLAASRYLGKVALVTDASEGCHAHRREMRRARDLGQLTVRSQVIQSAGGCALVGPRGCAACEDVAGLFPGETLDPLVGVRLGDVAEHPRVVELLHREAANLQLGIGPGNLGQDLGFAPVQLANGFGAYVDVAVTPVGSENVEKAHVDALLYCGTAPRARGQACHDGRLSDMIPWGLVQIRILTYNIHKCIGGIDRKYVPERVTDTIGYYQPDVALLQEVDAEVARSSYHRQVDVLGDMLGFRHRTWFPNHVLSKGRGSYGNAILSHFPLTDTQNIDLTMKWRKKRSAVHARYRVRLGKKRTRTVHVYNMHLGLSGYEREAQLERFLESKPFANFHPNTPVIVAGDLNDVWGNLGRRFLVPMGFRGPPRPIKTFPAYAPVRPLDSIFVRGKAELLHVYRARLQLAKQASDHLPLIADIRID